MLLRNSLGLGGRAPQRCGARIETLWPGRLFMGTVDAPRSDAGRGLKRSKGEQAVINQRDAPRSDAGRGLKPSWGRSRRPEWRDAPRSDAGRGLKREMAAGVGTSYEDAPRSDAGRGLKLLGARGGYRRQPTRPAAMRGED